MSRVDYIRIVCLSYIMRWLVTCAWVFLGWHKGIAKARRYNKSRFISGKLINLGTLSRPGLDLILMGGVFLDLLVSKTSKKQFNIHRIGKGVIKYE